MSWKYGPSPSCVRFYVCQSCSGKTRDDDGRKCKACRGSGIEGRFGHVDDGGHEQALGEGLIPAKSNG